MNKTLTRVWTDIANLVLVLLLLLLMVEVMSRAVLSAWLLIPSESDSNPQKYTDNAIELLYGGNAERYRQVIAETWSRRFVYEPLAEIKEAPVRGRFCNVADEGYRHLSPQEPLATSKRRLFVFGGSTTFGYGVADEETIPAAIQTSLRSRGISDIAVFNFGVGNDYSSLERLRMERMLTSGIKPDIAIFIDGLNEFRETRFPDRSGNSDYLAVVSEHPILGALSKSGTVSLLGKMAKRIRGDLSSGYRADAQTIGKMVDRLATNRDMLRGICERLAIRCYFVQQPVPFWGYDEGNRAIPMSDANRSSLADFPDRISAGYTASEHDPRYRVSDTLWLGGLSIPQNMYVDAVHYSPAFNEAIGVSIVEWLLKSQRIEKAGAYGRDRRVRFGQAAYQ